MQISHSNKFKLEKHYGIALVRIETADGSKTGVYVKADKENLLKIGRANDLTIDKLKKLGEIIATFEGETPPQDVKDHINSLIQ